MRVGELVSEQVDGDVVRSVRLTWLGGETRLWVRAPAGYAVQDDDLSPFVPVALLLAMRRSEPLALHGPVSPRLMSQLPLAQQLLGAWDASLTRVPVRAERETDPGERRPGNACGFSRGVDSTYSAIAPRPPGEALTRLVYCMHWNPGWSAEAEDAVRTGAERAAAAVGLELVVVATNVREPLWGIVDWNDAHGAALAMLGLSLPGAAGRFTIASNVNHANFLPRGSHPQLDPLWSTERVEVVHDDAELDRAGKLTAIVRDRPELLEHLHVCFVQDSVENCGSCSKCLLNMACLQAAGGSALPHSFPRQLDLDAIRKLSIAPLMVRFGFNAARAALPPAPEHDPLRDALAEMLRRSSRADWDEGDQSIYAHGERLLRAIWAGRPYSARAAGPTRPPAEFGAPDPSWPPPTESADNLVGLLATVDEEARRHAYGAGVVPPGRYLGELGALLAEPPEESAVPLRLADGRPVVDSLTGSGRAAAARWALAPLRWRDLAGPVPRARSVARRSRDALRALRGSNANGKAAAHTAGEPAGWLHASPGPGRLPLFAARHPAVDDVLLTTEPQEPSALGYGERRLLGYLEASAPASGRIGVHRPPLPWTHRWGKARTLTRAP
jgi:hypothetical protein